MTAGSLVAAPSCEEGGAAPAVESDAEPADLTTPAGGVGRVAPRMWVLRTVIFLVLPLLAMACAAAAGFLRYSSESAGASETEQIEAVSAARDTVTRMFSYTPDTVEQQLTAATAGLGGDFRDQFAGLINDVAIPGARQYTVATQATVQAVGVVAAEPARVTVVLFVNQSATLGDQPPSSTAFSARATVEDIDGRWLITAFEPI